MSNDKKINEKYEEYYRESDVGKQRVLKEIDDLQTTNDDFDYNFYPGYNDKDFIYNISKRLEFYHLKSLFNITEISKKCPTNTGKNDPFNFELTNNQQFLKNFMNNKTPYKGLVIFHGVGVGKTCTAVNISRSYREIFYKQNKKIICLVPKNIRGGWENTIYEQSKGTQQCSGDSFDDVLIKDKKGNVGKRDVKNLIREYYDFYGYLAFANSVEKLIKNEIGNRALDPDEKEELERRIINKNYSNRVLIIDEIHNLREENEMKGIISGKFRKGDEVFNQEKGINVFIVKKEKDGEYIVSDKDGIEEKVNGDVLNSIQIDKKSKDIIEKVIRYSQGMRIILLSATPMFNKSSEIIWLLNLLLKNDNRPTIKKDDVFDGDKITEEGIKILNNKTTGYFSYLRGENPISFPIRFYPDINSDKRCIGGNYNNKINYLHYPKYALFNGEIINNGFKFMKMYGSLMSSHQKNIYNKVPKPYIYSDNLKIIGAPFYLMERKKGIILRGNTPKKQLPDKLDMRKLSKKFIFTLAEIHRLNYKKAGLENIGKPKGYISRQVKGWINRYLASKTSDISHINYVYKWLERNIHENKFSSLIHNDFKYDNLVLSDDGKYDVLAILDWEMATLGDPLMDLGTSLGYWIDKTDPENIQQNKFNITTAEGNLNRGELVSKYSKESKLDVSNIVFYYVFGLFKIAVIVQQIFYRYKLGKTSDERFKDLNEIVKIYGLMAKRAIDKNSIDNLF